MRKPSLTLFYVLCICLLHIYLGSLVAPALGQTTPTAPPTFRLDEADGTAASNQIQLLFSTPVLESTATNPANYIVTNLLGATLLVTNVQFLNSTNILLTTSAPRLYGNNYLVTAAGLKDTSTSTISSNNIAPVSAVLTLLDERAFWYYYNPVILFGDNPDLGTAWRQPHYDPYGSQPDAAWNDNEFLRGAFWYGTTNIPAVPGAHLSRSDTAIIYYRTQISFPGSPLGSSFSMTHLIEDGAVFFLNGREVSRFNMPAGPIAWNTLASSAAGIAWRGPAPFPELKPGTNTVCVEVHTIQTDFTNTVFALRLQTRINSFASGPVVITRQPSSQICEEGRDVTFTFQGAGAERFQWYKNGGLVPGATNGTLTLNTISNALNGSLYSVAAWNSTSSNRSASAQLTVLVDTNPPSLLAAYVTGSNSIELTFSEPVAPITATNVANHTIRNFCNESIAISSAILTTPTNVLLQVLPGQGSNYYLFTRNIQDLSPRHNISSDTWVVVGLDLRFPIDSIWKYNQSGVDLGTAWKEPGYNDSSWPLGQGLFYNEDAALPAPKNTPLNLVTNSSSIQTYYFRKHFALPFGIIAINSFSHVIDDGVVLYSNGAEIGRFNMPTGAIKYATFASNTVADAVFKGPFTSALRLVQGDNVLAAEVHQSEPSSGDVSFGADLQLFAPSGTAPIPLSDCSPFRFSITNNLLELRWSNPSAILQKASSLQGTNTIWQNVFDATSPYLVPLTNQAGFYRLKVQ